MMTDINNMIPQQMVYPCMFYRMASFECALCRYGQDKSVREAIMKTLESVLRGLIKMKGFTSKNETKLVNLAYNLKQKFIAEGLENPVKVVTCFGLLKIGDQFVCCSPTLWFRSSFQEVIPFLMESSEGTYRCLCYLAAIVTRELSQEAK